MRVSSKKSDSVGTRSVWGALRPSTQMFMVALITQVVATGMTVLAFWGSLSTLADTLSLFLVCFVVSVIASTLVMILTVVGLFRYRRMTVWNILLLVFSLVTNPVLILALLATTL